MSMLKQKAIGSPSLPPPQIKMTSPLDSWVNAYEHVDFDIFPSPSNGAGNGKEQELAERQAMLPSGSGTTKAQLISPPSSPGPDLAAFPSRFPSNTLPPSSPIKHRHPSPLQLPAETTGPTVQLKTSLQPSTLVRGADISQGPAHLDGGAVRMPAQVHTFSHTRTTDLASTPSTSSTSSSGTMAQSSSSSHNLFGFGSSVSASSPGLSNAPGVAPQLSLGGLGLGLGMNDGAPAQAGQPSSQPTTSGVPPRSSSFKSFPSSPLAVLSPSNPNSPSASNFAAPSALSPEALNIGSSPFARRSSRNDAAIASTSIPPMTTTGRNSPVPLPPSSFPTMGLYRLSATDDGNLPPPPGLSHPSVGGGNVRGPLQIGVGVGPRGGHTSGDGHRNSISGDSIVSLAAGSKYPLLGYNVSSRPGTPADVPGTPRSFGNRVVSSTGSIMLGERQSVRAFLEYLDFDEDDDDDDEDGWLHDVEGDEEFFEYGFGPGHRRAYTPSVANDSVNGKQPSSEYTRQGSVGSMAKLYGKSQQIPIPAPLSLPRPVSGLPPHSSGQHPKLRIPAMAAPHRSWHASLSFRGFSNITGLVLLISALLCLFIVLPVTKAFMDDGVSMKILGNTRINATGQAVESREFLEELILVRFVPDGR